MDAVILMADGERRRTTIGRGDDRRTYIGVSWLNSAEKFAVYFEGHDIVGPRGDYVATAVLRRRFPRFMENRRFMASVETKARQCARERGWR